MGIEGIGARVARKEDKRFITGAGRYVDDMVVPGMKHAVFVRSPHAHAEIVLGGLQLAHEPGLERGHDQQDAVRAGRARLVDLVGIDGEVLAQHR